MKKLLFSSLLAWMLISNGKLISPTSTRPFWRNQATCNSVAIALGGNSHCQYVADSSDQTA